MACCVFLAFVIAYIVALRESLAKWRRPALVGFSIGVALVLLAIGLSQHRHHLPWLANGAHAEAHE